MDFPMMVKGIPRLGTLVVVAAFGTCLHAQEPAGKRPVEFCKGPYTATQWSTTKTIMPNGTVKMITGQVDLAQSSHGQMRMVAHAWSDGSERKKQPITQIHIQDRENHTFIMLFPNEHTALKTALPEFGVTDEALIPKSIKTDLGHRKIKGIDVTGERDVFTNMEAGGKGGSKRKVTRTVETWSNPKMCLTMEVITHDSNNNTSRNETTSVSTEEPAASLFEIPSGYTLSSH
jgi:hypothetical protein